MERNERYGYKHRFFLGRVDWEVGSEFFIIIFFFSCHSSNYTHTLLGGRDMGIPRVLLRLLLSLDRKCHIIWLWIVPYNFCFFSFHSCWLFLSIWWCLVVGGEEWWWWWGGLFILLDSVIVFFFIFLLQGGAVPLWNYTCGFFYYRDYSASGVGRT